MKKVLALVVIAIAALVILYVGMPVFAFGFLGFPLSIAVLTAIWIALNMKVVPQYNEGVQTFQLKSRDKAPVYILVAIFLYCTVIPMVTSLPILHTSEYRNLIGKVEIGENLSTHMAPISMERVRVVDQSLANILGDKVLGAQPALGSQVRLGTFNIQKVRNNLYWVAPLLHSGFFMWNQNEEGTNGYVMVNASNERDVKLVQEVNGKKVRIKYQPEGYFNDFLERHLYLSGFYKVGLTDYSFEIDDDGIPYWVVTKYKKTIGFSGENATGVVLVNTETGKCNEYGIENTPAWVDRIQPDTFIENQLNDWGNFVKGYFNFSNQSKLQITQAVTLVYGEDNNSYWYTGLTSVGADEATVGFVLVNTRTKKAVWYRQSGATEIAAQKSARGKVQEKRFSASGKRHTRWTSPAR